jgi:hypothetical protein
MTTSGTTAFNLELAEIIEEAYERASGGTRELRSGYEFRTARRSLSLLLLDWANRGLNLWTLDQEALPLVIGQATYALPTDTVDLVEQVIRANNSDVTISRIGVATYASIPVKTSTGRPVQLYFNRQIAPEVTVWPVPDTNNYTLVYWRMRRIQDAGNGINTQDIPFRFLPCLISGLAFYIAQKIPEGIPLLGQLKQQYEEDWLVASTEDREKVPVRFVPRGR